MRSANHSILLIDDHSENLENFMEILELEGYQILPSSNAEISVIFRTVRKDAYCLFPNLVMYNPSRMTTPLMAWYLSKCSPKNTAKTAAASGTIFINNPARAAPTNWTPLFQHR